MIYRLLFTIHFHLILILFLPTLLILVAIIIRLASQLDVINQQCEYDCN